MQHLLRPLQGCACVGPSVPPSLTSSLQERLEDLRPLWFLSGPALPGAFALSPDSSSRLGKPLIAFSVHSEPSRVLSARPGFAARPMPLIRPLSPQGQTLAQGAQQMLVKKASMDIAKLPDARTASYLCPLSLQTQVALVHHEVPWGLHALSGPWVPLCQALLKTEMAISELGPGATAEGSIGSLLLAGCLPRASTLVPCTSLHPL